MEASPYLLYDKVGPWEQESSNPLHITTLEMFYPQNMKIKSHSNNKKNINENNNNIISKFNEKLPIINGSTPMTTKNKHENLNQNYLAKKNSLSRERNIIKNEDSIKLTKKNFLLPRKKPQTIHIQDLEHKLNKFVAVTSDKAAQNAAYNRNIKEKLFTKRDFQLKITGNNSNNNNIESPTRVIAKNLDYFTPAINIISQKTNYKTRNKSVKESSMDQSSEIIVQGQIMNLNNCKISKENNNFSLQNENKFRNIKNIKQTLENSHRGNRLIDENIKIKLDHLKKIEKNSMHFLKYFLLKYEKDAVKMKKFLKN